LAQYGRDNDWVFGPGEQELTYLPQIGIITDDMLGNMNLAKDQGSYLTYEGTHREHILAIAALLKLRYAGFLESQDLLVLENLKRNPLITAILARVDDGNQSETIRYLEKFPRELPLNTGWEQWGGASQWLYFFIVKAVVDGH
jgi:hypothetical protein